MFLVCGLCTIRNGLFALLLCVIGGLCFNSYGCVINTGLVANSVNPDGMLCTSSGYTLFAEVSCSST